MPAAMLSGRTKDQNIGYIAEYVTALGIDLKQMRVVGDEERAILDALNAPDIATPMSSPPAGSGRPHYDITADCMAKAFGARNICGGTCSFSAHAFPYELIHVLIACSHRYVPYPTE
jgi:molybdopterin-biosynthesis enzyme MoeA-like protein